MANDYIKLWVKDYRALLEPFNEAERGRILWAMMDYKETGSEPKFLGNERFVWAAIKPKSMLPMKHTSVRPLPIGQTVPEVAGLANQKKIRKTQKTEWVLKNPQLRKIQKNQPARLMTPRKATGSGLDATVCLRPTWQQNFGICEKPGWKMLWWLLRWKKRCATKRSTHGAMLSAYSIRQRRSTLQRLQSGKKLTSKIKEIGLTEKRRAETTF